MAILGVIVAGGRGERLGAGRPKALVKVGGRTLLERAIAILEPLCDEIVVAASPLRPLRASGYRIVTDSAGAEGPLAGLVAGLVAQPFDRALALGVDFPLMRTATLGSILAQLGEHAAAIPEPGGMPQPLAAAYSPAAAAALRLRLDAGARALVAEVMTLDPLLLGDVALAAMEVERDDFFNLNTPADLATAERRLMARARTQ